jgi:serine protease Do
MKTSRLSVILPLAALSPLALPAQPPDPAATYAPARGLTIAGSSSIPAGGVSVGGGPLHIATPGVPFTAFAAAPMEMESVTYLGVEASRVAPALASQLNLKEGTGLLVTSVEAGSPAAAVFKPHDVLLKLDDQVLIVQLQLSVLIRNHAEGDEVTISYVRAGKPATAKVKLGRHDVPKGLWGDEVGFTGSVMGFGTGPGTVSFATGPGMPVAATMPPPVTRQEADRLLSLMPHGPGPDPMVQMQIENRGAPGLSAVSVNPANSRIAYNDESGTLELTIKDGQKTVIAKDPKGTVTFSGPATTPEERKAMPPTVRENLEKLEGMPNTTFRTNERFRGTDTKVAMPPRRSI